MSPLRSALVALFLVLPQAAAQSQPVTALDRLTVSVGVFDSRMSLDGRVRAEGTFAGRVERYADDFDVGGTRRIKTAELTFSPWERHEFGLRYYRDRYRRTLQLSEELRFESQTFPIDVDLTGRSELCAIEGHYTWWFAASDVGALGAQVGVLRLEASLGLSGSISSPSAGGVALDAEASDHLYAPLVGLAGRRMFGERLRGFVELRAIDLGFDGYDGTAIAGSVGIEYFFGARLGVSLQYHDTRIRVEREGELGKGRLELGLRGPEAQLRFRF